MILSTESSHNDLKQETQLSFGPPLNLGRDLFGEEVESNNVMKQRNCDCILTESEIKQYYFPGNVTLKIREYSFSPTNANFVWKGNEQFAEWILKNKQEFENKKILELAAGTGILSIFLKKQGTRLSSPHSLFCYLWKKNSSICGVVIFSL
jgi:hypothetical protein